MAVTVFPTPVSSTVKSPTIVIINSTQTWTAPAGVSQIELLLVGGGGGGGGTGANGANGGGGGGGGVVSQTITVTPATSYTVTIGAGGAAGTASSASAGGNGSSSTFGSLVTSFGGGGGQSSDQNNPTAGQVASGGGQGTPTNGQSGSGGGAALVSYPFVSTSLLSANLQSNGAIAIVQGSFGYRSLASFVITGNPGINGYGAGGGGGTTVSTRIYGGLNAGTGAYSGNAGTAGTANFGGGGGGSLFNGSYFASGAGGSGTCIIRYWS